MRGRFFAQWVAIFDSVASHSGSWESPVASGSSVTIRLSDRRTCFTPEFLSPAFFDGVGRSGRRFKPHRPMAKEKENFCNHNGISNSSQKWAIVFVVSRRDRSAR